MKETHVEGAQNAVKNLEIHHVAGVTDLRGRVARCDAATARLAADIKSCNESIQLLNQNQQEQQGRLLDRVLGLDAKVMLGHLIHVACMYCITIYILLLGTLTCQHGQ